MSRVTPWGGSQNLPLSNTGKPEPGRHGSKSNPGTRVPPQPPSMNARLRFMAGMLVGAGVVGLPAALTNAGAYMTGRACDRAAASAVEEGSDPRETWTDPVCYRRALLDWAGKAEVAQDPISVVNLLGAWADIYASTGKVAELDLRRTDLSEMPPLHPMMVRVDVSENRIRDLINPKYPTNLRNVVFLNASDNQLETVPNEGHLANLQVLSVAENNITALPDSVSEYLRQLDLRGNDVRPKGSLWLGVHRRESLKIYVDRDVAGRFSRLEKEGGVKVNPPD